MATLTDLFRHNRWANLALLDALRTLDDALLDVRIEGTYGTVRDTLTHVAGAEARYVAALREATRPDMPDDGAGLSIDALSEMLAASGDDLIALAESAEPERTSRREVNGTTWSLAHHVVFTQAINHATEHRAHVVTTLSAHGVEAISLDAWSWGSATGSFRPADA